MAAWNLEMDSSCSWARLVCTKRSLLARHGQCWSGRVWSSMAHVRHLVYSVLLIVNQAQLSPATDAMPDLSRHTCCGWHTVHACCMCPAKTNTAFVWSDQQVVKHDARLYHVWVTGHGIHTYCMQWNIERSGGTSMYSDMGSIIELTKHDFENFCCSIYTGWVFCHDTSEDGGEEHRL